MLQQPETNAEILGSPSFLADSFEFETPMGIPLSKSLHKSELELEPNVSLWSGIALIIGATIGSGIFASPGPVLEYTSSVGSALLIWILAGLLSMTGGICYAELGTIMPKSGGEHPYLLRAFGSLPAFLFSLSGVIISRPGSIAIISVVCAEYLVRLFYYNHEANVIPWWLSRIVAMVVVLVLTGINAASSRAATQVQDVFTVLKVSALVWISWIGISRLVTGQEVSHTFDHSIFEVTLPSPGNFSLALYTSLWANNLNIVAGELTDPVTNLPRAIIGSGLIIIVMYVCINVSYYAVLPPAIVKASTTIGLDFGKQVFGHVGALIIPLIVVASTFGAANASMITGARISFVSAQSGHAPKFLSSIHPKWKTPSNALFVQSLFSIFFIIVGDFKSLVNFYSMIAWTFYLWTVSGLLYLRYTDPFEVRPFKAWIGAPIIFCIVTVFILGFSLFEAPTEGLAALGFFIFGTFLFWIGHYFELTEEIVLEYFGFGNGYNRTPQVDLDPYEGIEMEISSP